jgi:hypothetical protein
MNSSTRSPRNIPAKSGNRRRQPLADLQFVVACVGIAPAILLVFDAVRRSRRALLWLGIGVAIYIAGALLLDAAIHGWDDLKLLP